MSKPLVSILIAAYNAQEWLAETLESAVGQSWSRKEIIVVDDGSRDRTGDIAREFASKGVKLLRQENAGLCAGVNTAYQQCQGDYIQFLDADDLLAPDKIERQIAALHEGDSRRLLLSSPWAPFYYRTRGARFVRNSFWEDLSPVEWLLRKMSEGTHMQNATWLVSRELTEAAGPWDTSLHYDQDGEYFARVLLASVGTRFVSGTGIFYRDTGTNRISYIGNSDKKKDSLFRSMKLHMQYLRSLEDSDRVRKACVAYMQIWYSAFYPERKDILAEMQVLANQFGGQLREPSLSSKYSLVKGVFGYGAARQTQMKLAAYRIAAMRCFDKLRHKLETNLQGNRLESLH